MRKRITNRNSWFAFPESGFPGTIRRGCRHAQKSARDRQSDAGAQILDSQMSQTVKTVDPVVLRAARSACALAASFSG